MVVSKITNINGVCNIAVIDEYYCCGVGPCCGVGIEVLETWIDLAFRCSGSVSVCDDWGPRC
jgi:hypothetical protein